MLRQTCIGHRTKNEFRLQDFIAERAEGTYVWTTDGQKHLDMACGEAWLGSLLFALLVSLIATVLHIYVWHRYRRCFNRPLPP